MPSATPLKLPALPPSKPQTPSTAHTLDSVYLLAMTNLNRATKAQLIDLLQQQADTTSTLEQQVNESKEQITVALWIAAVSFCLGLLF